MESISASNNQIVESQIHQLFGINSQKAND